MKSGIAAAVTQMNAARSGYAHMLSTDHPVESAELPGYFLDLTGGTPSRCHPLAPKSCKSEDIESPERLQPLTD